VSRLARVVAQAKINLFLRVLAREVSGYHSIETAFLRVDLGDEVCVREASGRSIGCTGPAMPANGLGATARNIAFRAAAAYANATGWPRGFAIEIIKRIPVGGGLGGGSADAGAVLRALDALSPRPLGPRLVELAIPLGADVPFMTIESPMALAWGRGERLLPLHPLDQRDVVLLVPNFPIATGDAYGWVASDRGTYAPSASVLVPESLATWEGMSVIATNDFERPVARRHPEIGELVDALKEADASVAMLSGSGSTVFGVFSQLPDPTPGSHLAGITAITTRTSTRVAPVEIAD
jgi:4-diphosphocytidyl-2C-methyl-D-erythritol kinase